MPNIFKRLLPLRILILKGIRRIAQEPSFYNIEQDALTEAILNLSGTKLNLGYGIGICISGKIDTEWDNRPNLYFH